LALPCEITDFFSHLIRVERFINKKLAPARIAGAWFSGPSLKAITGTFEEGLTAFKTSRLLIPGMRISRRIISGFSVFIFFKASSPDDAVGTL